LRLPFFNTEGCAPLYALQFCPSSQDAEGDSGDGGVTGKLWEIADVVALLPDEDRLGGRDVL
jgi:hypothetical protein